MTYVVEYIEEHTKRNRAVKVECDCKDYAHIEAMRHGANILKLKSVYEYKPRVTDK